MLQRPQEIHNRLLFLRTEFVKLLNDLARLAPPAHVRFDCLHKVLRSAVVEEEDPLANSPERCSPELVRPRVPLGDAVCQTFTHAVDEKIGQAHDRSVAFDLGGVTFIASSFLRLCVQTAKTVGSARFSVRNLSPELKKVFVISGLDKQLTIT